MGYWAPGHCATHATYLYYHHILANPPPPPHLSADVINGSIPNGELVTPDTPFVKSRDAAGFDEPRTWFGGSGAASEPVVTQKISD